MGVPKRLTEMQKRFAEYLVFGGPEGPVNKAEAAELAGYSRKRCRQEGAELTNPRQAPLVVKYLDELKQERNLKFGVNYEGHIAELARIKDLALKKNSFSAAVNAETNRGKAGGLYIDRKIIKHGKLEDMTEEQLEMKMAQIEEDYASLLTDDNVIDVSESELSSSHKKLEKPIVPKSE
jgi:phage terminase small subunit